MEIIIILIMLFCEMMFVEGSNIIRYNRYKSEKKMLFVMLFYSIICLYYAVGNSGSLWIKYICWIGFFQGIFGIVENLINNKKYHEKDEFIRTFEKNVFIILSFDTLEKYTVSELKLLSELNKKYMGQKCGDILLIQKDKKKRKLC